MAPPPALVPRRATLNPCCPPFPQRNPRLPRAAETADPGGDGGCGSVRGGYGSTPPSSARSPPAPPPPSFSPPPPRTGPSPSASLPSPRSTAPARSCTASAGTLGACCTREISGGSSGASEDTVDVLFLDNTYCHPSLNFPSRPVVAEQAGDLYRCSCTSDQCTLPLPLVGLRSNSCCLI